MTVEQIPLIQKDISMLTDKFDELSKEVKSNFLEYKEEAKLQQKHREESIKFHADLLEKLDNRFAWKWTERVLTFIWTWIWIAIIGAIMALILKQ